jgi:hypothetical protein
MCTIEIYGWRPSCKKVSHTVLLQERLGLPLSAAKEITDMVLADGRPQVTLQSEVEASLLIAALDELGFSAKLTSRGA